MIYTQEEINQALVQLASIIVRCQRSQEKFKEGTSQYSLLKNRIKALQIATCVLENKDALTKYTQEEMKQAIIPISSIIHKTTKARSKYEKGSTQYKRFTPTIDTMLLCKHMIENYLAS